jgi:hypothetical protein
MSRRIPVALFLAASALAGAAHAGNLIQNPDFDLGLEGWTQIYGSGEMTADDSIGLPDPPSLHLVADANPGGINVESSCMEVDSTNMDLRINAGGGPGQFYGAIESYSDTACTVALDVLRTVGVPLGLYRGYAFLNFPCRQERAARSLLSASAF